MIVIVDYGVGNLGSLVRAFRRAGTDAKITSSPDEIASARGLVLPGVGAFGVAMDTMRQRGILPVLSRKSLTDKTPTLGICLGMQLFFSGSEESQAPGLGWIEGHVRRFHSSDGEKLRVPHVGWNEVKTTQESVLFTGLDASPHFYYCHSFRAEGVNDSHSAAHTEYGGRFVSAVTKENLFGVQFHPERSHHNGQTLLRNFLKLTQCSNRELSPACS